MKVIKQNGVILVRTHDLMFVITPSKDKGYKLTEINSNNKCYSFNDTTFTGNGINGMMIQRSRCYGVEIPSSQLI